MLENYFKRLRVSAFSLAIVACGGAGVLAQAPKAAPDQEFIAAKAAFGKVSLDEPFPVYERAHIRLLLFWAGYLDTIPTGELDPLTYAAIRRFEKDNKLKVDGIITASEIVTLHNASTRAQFIVKFKIVEDVRNKISIGLPEKLLAKPSTNASGGMRWQDREEKATLDIQVFKPEDRLSGVFEKGTAPNVQGRKINYKLLQPNYFVIVGETSGGKFYRKVVKGRDDILRGFSLGYDKSLRQEFDRLSIAIAETFYPYHVPLMSEAAWAEMEAQRLKRWKSHSNRITAVYVAPDLLITSEKAYKGCRLRQLTPDHRGFLYQRSDSDSDLVLLRASGNGSVPLHSGDIPPQALLLQRDAEGELAASSAAIAGNSVQASLQQGGAGAPLFDRNGALVGIITSEPAQKFAVAGTIPQMRYRFADAKAIAALTGIAPTALTGAERSAGDIAAERASAVVSIVCGP